jgi:starch synthase (maltosyl-transferring)
MHRLAKLGFDMSYPYFTWRNEKWELEEYFKELTSSPAKEYMRGMLFPTTPDILPIILQNAPREAFTMRAFLAATLSSLFGMYNG